MERSKSSVLCPLLIGFAMMALPVLASAQTQTTGSITGSIKDQTGAFLPGVEVKAQSEQTGESHDTITTEVGSYLIPLLPPGTYTVTFALPGFTTVANKGVTVNATEKITLDGNLKVATTGTTVEVSAAAQLIQAETTSLGRVIDDKMTTALPLPTKNYTQMLALSSGVAAGIADTSTLGRGSINVSSNGGRQVANTFLLDGIDANNIHSDTAEQNGVGSNGVPVPSTEMLQEFKVQTSLYDAQYGRNAGASINVVTKGGTNHFHGSVFEYLRNNDLNANNFFLNATGTPRPEFHQNQYGATLGGPVQKDKTFFFIGYQGTRQINGAATSGSDASLVLPAIPQVRTPATLGAVFGGMSGSFGGVAVAKDGSNINPVALALLNVKIPTSSIYSKAGGAYLIPSPQTSSAGVNYSAAIPGTFFENQFTLNLDHQLTQNQKLSIRLFGANVPQVVPLGGGANVPGFPLYQDFKNRNASITYTNTIAPTLVNEARIGFSRPAGQSVLSDPSSVGAVGISRPSSEGITALPAISLSGSFGLGYGNSSDQKTIPNTFVYHDDISWTHGVHFVRSGFEARRYQVNLFNRIIRGSISFLTFPDFLLGMSAAQNGTNQSNINSISLSSGITTRDYRATDLNAYFQDDWKITPKLTLNLGMRYDFMGFQYDTQGRSGNYELSLYQPPPSGGQTDAGFVQPAGTHFPIAGLPQVDRTFLNNPDNKNFSPRVGFAYRLMPKMVLRAGYGIFWERMSDQMTLQLISNQPFVTTTSGSGTAIPTATFQNPFPTVPPVSAYPIVPAIYAPPFTASTPASSPTILDPNLRIPYLQQYSMNFQYEFPGAMLLEVGYVGSKGTHLPWTRNVNQTQLASPTNPINGITTNTTTNAQNRVQYSGFSNTGFTQVQTSADSHYDSLQMSVTKRLSHGLQFLAAYTYAKSIDDNSGASGSTLSSISGDATNTRQARSLSDYDRPNRFTFSYIYTIPAWGFHLNDSSFGQKFFSGWQVAGITTLQSGSPFSITDSKGASLFGTTASRASWAPGASVSTAKLTGSTESRLASYFNKAAFVTAGQLWGNTGRNILLGPGQENFDASLTKITPFKESKDIEWRMEVFNALNHPNFANPSGSLQSGSYGTITSTVANARVIQFGLRVVY